MGYSSKASSENGTALGANSRASGEGATASGHSSKATAENSTALGTNSRAYGDFSTAIGANSKTHEDLSIALGANSSTEEVVSTEGMTVAGHNYTFAGSVAKGTVSIGNRSNDGINRTMTNLAAGRIENGSTDAVNGSQLFILKEIIEELSARLDEMCSFKQCKRDD